MPPECANTFSHRLRAIVLPALPLRLVVSALLVVALLASPLPITASCTANLPPQPSNHLPRKHQPGPSVVKIRSILASAVRCSSRSAPELRLRAGKRLPALVVRPLTPAPSSGRTGVPSVFRPLRC